MEKISINREDYNSSWDFNYALAQIYYDHYGCLDIPADFRTINGYERDEKGVLLGRWISSQRSMYFKNSLSSLDKQRIEKLNALEMIWDVYKYKWDKMYLLAKKYYEYHRDLDVPNDFITVNGYIRDENGSPLGAWIRDLRSVGQGTKISFLDEERLEKLNSIEMIWDIYKYRWDKMFLLAKAYYDENGNSNIKARYKTLNGYEEISNGFDLGSFIRVQRKRYEGSLKPNLTDEQLLLLESIKLPWFVKKNKSCQEETITAENKERKEIEILNRFRSYLVHISLGDSILSKEEMNQGFIDELDGKRYVKR